MGTYVTVTKALYETNITYLLTIAALEEGSNKKYWLNQTYLQKNNSILMREITGSSRRLIQRTWACCPSFWAPTCLRTFWIPRIVGIATPYTCNELAYRNIVKNKMINEWWTAQQTIQLINSNASIITVSHKGLLWRRFWEELNEAPLISEQKTENILSGFSLIE